ncbi:hypothetical protein BWI93_05400 [Siphonobacter sp. BAB-5385]|uniref:hypothetical protein n=1 Tax=Siphonobacter sp. BAB-5385 TaxID=1864822 RepID=UPI000B9E2B1A|nr:hypothetical protein [Siphonobacter sp. BAB-5385]OZI09183.1 hypothetical protein BWI93_05400 [Siphonobacter sp. BAB-5385]
MLSLSQLLPYLADSNKKHELYARTLEVKKALAETFGEEMPDYLIKGVGADKKQIFKPLEQEKHQNYKRSVYRNPFRSFPSRVIEQLDSIQQADDFTVYFPTQDALPNELLQSYLETDFPGGLPFRTWFFTRGLNLYVNDPNGKIVVVPETPPGSDRELPQPRVFDVPSDRVIECQQAFAVIESARKSTIRVEGKLKQDGRILWFFDQESYTIATEVERISVGGNKNRSVFEIQGLSKQLDTESNQLMLGFNPPLHYCGKLPVSHIGNAKHLLEEKPSGTRLFKSVLTDAIEPLRDGQELYVMSRIEFYQHLYSKYWQYVTTPCPLIKTDKCSNGLLTQDYEQGNFKHKRGSACPICGGSSFVMPKSALDTIAVTLPKKAGPTDGNTPMPSAPFAGYVEKSIDNLTKMLEEFKNLEDRAWSTINMEFMTRVPLVQSGVAKTVDRQPANNWLRSQAAHLVESVMNNATAFVANQRYSVAIGKKSVGAILPKISVPKFFDIYDPSYLLEEIDSLRKIGADQAMISEKMVEYERKRTGKDSPTSRLLRIKQAIQPLFGFSQADVISLYAGGIGGATAISREDFLLNIRFDDFVQRALIEVGDAFWSMEETAHKELFYAYVAEEIPKLPQAVSLYDQIKAKDNGSGGAAGPIDED